MINTITSVSKGRFSSYDGTSIYYEVRGKGEPLVFIYGIACLINHWHHQVEYFSRTHQVITFDLRGHHQSHAPADNNELKIESIAKDIPFLLRTLGHKQAHFVGHSFGAQVLLKTYDLFPEIFKSLCFINGFAKNPLKGMFGLDVVEPFFYFIKSQHQKNPALSEQIWRACIDNPIAMWASALAGGFNIKLTEFKDIEIYARGVSKMRLDVLIPYFEDMMSFSGEDIARKISAPTLIIAGDKDLVTPLKFQHELHEYIKKSLFVLVPYGSHCTQLDFPDYTNLKLSDFLNQIKSNSSLSSESPI